MDFLSIEQIASAIGKSRRTVDRKLTAFKKKFPERFEALTRRNEKHLEYAIEIVEEVMADEIAITPFPQLAKKNVPKKQSARPKAQPTPAVIHLEQIPEEQERELADFRLILEDYKTGQYSLPECITRHNVSQNDFWYWIHNRPLFNSLFDECYKRHKKAFNVYLRELAKESLKKMVTGYDKVMESTSFMQKMGPNGEVIQIPQERRVQQKHVMPNVNAIMFALTNKDPDEWKRVFGNSPIAGNTEQDPLEKMSDAELLDFIDEAKKQGLLSAGENS